LGSRPQRPAKRKQPPAEREGYYDRDALVDAPEHHEYSRAMGILTWSTWDHGVRPIEHRVNDFVRTFPPTDPVKCVPGGSLVRQPDRTFAPGTSASRIERFVARDWRPGSLYELLARYGLKVLNAPPAQARSFEPGSMRDTTKRRNIRLRVLHGGVDIEPENMDAAKAEYLDRQESKQAAKDIRDAVKRMKDELKGQARRSDE
jgi:hypothetical protein